MTAGLAAVESFFGAGTSVAPMPGATLLRFLPALQDPWSGGLHLDAPPGPDELRQWLSSWRAFDQPGALRWSAPAGTALPADVLEAAAAAEPGGAIVTFRPVFVADAVAGPRLPDDITIEPIIGGARQWAAFEVLARWIDPADAPERWTWRAKRVRHLLEGGRGQGWLARSPAMPVAAAVVMDPPDHRHGAARVLAVVVHGANRSRGIAASLAATAAAARGPVTVLGPASGAPAARGAPSWLNEVETLVEMATSQPSLPSRR